jgi:hypothetical protein
VLVVSDLHASELSSDTHVIVEPPLAMRNQHPLADLRDLIVRTPLSADIVLSAGDICDKSDTVGIAYAWKELHAIASRLGAQSVYSTPGNHDLRTRDPVADRSAALQNLVPRFPTPDPTVNSRFWGEGFALIEEKEFRLLIVNSCHAYPNHPEPGASEANLSTYDFALNRGIFSAESERSLVTTLEGLPERAVNLVLVHHHPLEHEQRAVFKDQYGEMERGSELLRVLEEAHPAGRWFVIHGHKHVPRLTHAGGPTANSPIVFGAASVGGKLWDPLNTVVRNQFHVIEFELEPVPGLARLRGSIESYMWGFGVGWQVASRRNCGLPGLTGFGVPVDHRVLAYSVAQHLHRFALQFANWRDVAEALPAILYQTPADFERFEECLERDGLILLRDSSERVLEVARRLP